MTNKIARRFGLGLAALGMLFCATSVLQYRFTHAKLIGAVASRLGAWGQELREQLVLAGKWDIGGFRRADISAPYYFVLTADGLLIEAQGFAPGLLPRMRIPTDPIYEQPTEITSPLGEG